MALHTVTMPFPLESANDRMQQILALNRKLRRQMYDFHNLFDILLELTTIHDRENLMYAVLINLIGLAGTEGGAILLASGKDECFSPAKARGLSPEQIQQLTIPRDHPMIQEFRIDQQPWIATNAASESGYSIGNNHGNPLPGISLIAPIAEHNNLLGLTVLGEKLYGKTYSDHEIEVISLLDNFTAIVLSNVELYERMERLSTTDPLTGLHNRRSFERILQNELARAKRFQMNLSLVMLDVDHFKHFNDAAGHQAGDDLLQELARLMANTVRSTDYVARYGGEEFALILPGVESQNALVLCERLRKKVEDHDFAYRHVQERGRVTVSFGAAYYPGDAMDAHSLVAKADVALYTAKRQGRNQCWAYQAEMENETPLVTAVSAAAATPAANEEQGQAHEKTAQETNP